MMRCNSAGKIGIKPRRRCGRSPQDGIENYRRGISGEGHASRGHFIKDGAEGEQVGAGIEFFAAGLFGRHVGDRANGRSRTGQVLFNRRAFGGGRLRARQLRQSEVEDFSLTAFRNKDVGRLDVSMNDFFSVRCIERVGDLDGQGEQGLGVQRLARDAMLQSHTVQEFHGDEGLAVLLADVVDGADVWVIQSGCGLGFALESSQGLGIAGNFLGKKFESDETMKPGVFSFVDHAHATTAQLLENAVVRNRSAYHWQGMLRGGNR